MRRFRDTRLGRTLSRLSDRPVGKGVCGAFGLALIWEGVPYIFRISPLILPPFHSVVASVCADWQVLWQETAFTGLESVVAWVLAIIIAGLLACAMDLLPSFEKLALYPLLAVQNVPKVALVPLIIVWCGHGFPPIIVMGILVAFFPVFEGFRKGLARDATGIRVVFGPLCGNRFARLFKIKLPEAMPDIMHGSRLGMTLATVGVIVGELQAPDRGLGRVISDTDIFKTDLQFAAVLLVSVLGVCLYEFVRLLERTALLAPYNYSVSSIRDH